MATPPAADPRQPGSLTDWLRNRSDDQLSELLRRRPDLALPAPADLAMLASRLSVRTSVHRAIDGLDAFALRLLDALVLASSGEIADLAAAVSLLGAVDPADVERGLDELQDAGLVWGTSPRLHLVATVRESLGTYPAGLGRPAADLFRSVSDLQIASVLHSLGIQATAQPRAAQLVADKLTDASYVRALIDACDPDEREVLDRLAAGPPIGSVRNAHLPGGNDRPAPHRLINRGLLVAIDAQTVELPRELGLALRAVPVGEVQPTPPDVPVTVHSPDALDRMGTGAVLEALRLVSALADSWAAQPPAMLRSGGIGVRDLRRTARDLGVDDAAAALFAEVAAAAGLIGPTNGVEPVYL
ncbi:MAG TPA: hypothetical protein VJ831_11210, partial [Jatrophihabitantaceae bacterium]|nr:hypothetical protein [Jatrophihabitantaceae bacterium]